MNLLSAKYSSLSSHVNGVGDIKPKGTAHEHVQDRVHSTVGTCSSPPLGGWVGTTKHGTRSSTDSRSGSVPRPRSLSSTGRCTHIHATVRRYKFYPRVRTYAKHCPTVQASHPHHGAVLGYTRGHISCLHATRTSLRHARRLRRRLKLSVSSNGARAASMLAQLGIPTNSCTRCRCRSDAH